MVGHLEEKRPVLVHCSDGWDRTSQLAALSQLLVDPYYRTLGGFAVLIEKDFCSFGHMLAQRSDPTTHEYSPILLQFLDCVFQILDQFPGAFEFTEQFLVLIADGYLSGWSKTFSADCERDRDGLPGPSFWGLIDFSALRNPGFKECGVIRPKATLQAMQLWASVYLRHSCFV